MPKNFSPDDFARALEAAVRAFAGAVSLAPFLGQRTVKIAPSKTAKPKLFPKNRDAEAALQTAIRATLRGFLREVFSANRLADFPAAELREIFDRHPAPRGFEKWHRDDRDFVGILDETWRVARLPIGAFVGGRDLAWQFDSADLAATVAEEFPKLQTAWAGLDGPGWGLLDAWTIRADWPRLQRARGPEGLAGLDFRGVPRWTTRNFFIGIFWDRPAVVRVEDPADPEAERLFWARGRADLRRIARGANPADFLEKFTEENADAPPLAFHRKFFIGPERPAGWADLGDALGTICEKCDGPARRGRFRDARWEFFWCPGCRRIAPAAGSGAPGLCAGEPALAAFARFWADDAERVTDFFDKKL